MADRIELNLGDVQKTMLLPLWGRAVESRKKDPMLVDEQAVRIIDRLNFDFEPLARNLDTITQIAWIKRSLIGDRVIKAFLSRYPDGTIVNIGCGFDTTFDRIDNGKLTWYDLDLPDVIELRTLFFDESDRRRMLSSSFLEKGWLEEIAVKGNVLFMAAGVFYYFQEPEIKDFVLRLIDRYPGSELLFDICSPLGMRVANKKVVESSGLDERSHLTWGLENKKDLLSWDSRIRLIGTYYYFRTLKIGIRNFLIGTISDLLGIQYMIHLGLGNIE
ncbi:MAG: class I SAM-dependent methyltransferase [Anaerolineales bacterium]|nr:class I SAM-dependent methyltransferase [Anaerolineales bacterium]